MNPTHVSYDAEIGGFSVRLMSGGVTLDEYNGGNSPFASTDVIDRDDPAAYSYDQLLDFAEQQAREMAAEYGNIPIEHNEDLLAEEREMAGMETL